MNITQQAIERMLREQVPASRLAAPAAVRRRTLAALHQAGIEQNAQRHTRWTWALASLALAATCLAAVIAMQQPDRDRAVTPIADLTPAFDLSLPSPRSPQVTLSKPLLAEARSIADDAQYAIGLVSRNMRPLPGVRRHAADDAAAVQ